MTPILYSLLVVFGIGLLIFIHEFGHFLCARMIGVRVEVFALGFGPRLFGVRRGGTDYRVAAIPLGGYVQVAGQDPGDHRYPESESLHSKTVGQRFLFFSGGVVMNVLFALVAFPLVFHAGVAFRAPVVGDVAAGSAAWEAYLQAGDRILAVNGKEMYSAENMAVEIALAGHREVTLLVRRGEEEFPVVVRPHYDPAAGLYDLGAGTPLADEPAVLEVDPDGPAWRAGLRSGDLLLSIDDKPVRGRAVRDELKRADPSAPMTLTVERDQARIRAVVRPEPDGLGPPLIGVMPLPRVVEGLRNHPLIEDLGLRHGDVVLAVDGKRFVGPDLGVAAAGGPTLTLTVLRDGKELRLSAPATPEQRRALADHVALKADPDSLLVDPQPDSPAQRAGILAGDRVVAIDGETVSDWEEMRRLVQATADPERDRTFEITGPEPVPAPRSLAIALDRGGAAVEVRVTPEQTPEFDPGFTAQIPVLFEIFQREGLAESVKAGLVSSMDLIKQLYVTLKRLFTGDVSARNLGGIITISRVSYQFAKQGPSRFFYFLALLSINLAFINVLPIPVLDGGHLLFLLIEKIKGSPVSTRVFSYAQILGLIFVLALIVFVTYNDILRLL